MRRQRSNAFYEKDPRFGNNKIFRNSNVVLQFRKPVRCKTRNAIHYVRARARLGLFAHREGMAIHLGTEFIIFV